MRRLYSEQRRQAISSAQELLSQAGLAVPFTINDLLSRSKRYLGHPVLLMPFECPPKSDGAVFAASGKYIICYRANTDELYRRYVIMHELAHLVLGHCTPMVDGWFTFTREMEMAADLLAERLINLSLGIADRKMHWLLQWFHARLNNGNIPEQDRLRSLFE